MKYGLLLLGIVFSQLVQAAPADALVSRLAAVHDFSAHFEQTILDQDETRLQVSSGEMAVARPHKLYWHVTAPYEQLIVSDGEHVWIHDPDLAQVIRQNMDEDMADAPALLFSGDPQRVTEAFLVTVASQRDDSITWRLQPLADDSLFDLLEVTFRDEQPTDLRLVDALGQKTLIQFSDVSLNREMDPRLFEFEPPADADLIIDQ